MIKWISFSRFKGGNILLCLLYIILFLKLQSNQINEISINWSSAVFEMSLYFTTNHLLGRYYFELFALYSSLTELKEKYTKIRNCTF